MVFAALAKLYFVIQKWFYFALATSKIYNPRQTHPPAYHPLSKCFGWLFPNLRFRKFCYDFLLWLFQCISYYRNMLLKYEKYSDIPNHSKPYTVCYICTLVYICVCILVYTMYIILCICISCYIHECIYCTNTLVYIQIYM